MKLRKFPSSHVQAPADANVARVRLDTIAWSNGRRFGDVWLAHGLWQLLKLDDIVARHIPRDEAALKQRTSKP